MLKWSGCVPYFLFTATILVFFDVGCVSRNSTASDSRAATSYANAYKALMVSYRDRTKELTSRPLPPKSLPMKRKRSLLARQVGDVADADTEFGNRLDALHPPAQFRELQNSTRSYFKVSAEDTYRWAEAIRHGNREARTRAGRQLDIDDLAALTQMQQAVKQIGGPASGLQSAIDEMQQSTKK